MPGEVAPREVSIPSQNGPDQVKIQDLQYGNGAKVDARNSMTHTFSGTAEETFEHRFGRIPTGLIVVSQSKAAYISMDKTKWTIKRLYAQSSVADNVVTFILV